MADICITSGFKIQNSEAESITVEKAPGSKCERCWKYTTDVGAAPAHPTICARCAGVVQKELKSPRRLKTVILNDCSAYFCERL